MSGYFLVARGIFDHPLFASNKPFTELEAWMWLIEHANFEDGLFRHGHEVFLIPRGSLGTRYRFLAASWRWSTNRVIRVLNLWKSQHMIGVKTEHGYIHLTLCNYEAYQKPWSDDGTQTEHKRDSDGTATDTKAIQVIQETKNTPFSLEFEQLWSIFPKQRIGKKDSAWRAWKRAIKNVAPASIISGAEAYAGSSEVARGFAKGLAAWLNDDRWAVRYDPAEAEPVAFVNGVRPSWG